MYALVVSPIPTHPSNQGNSARILMLTKSLQELGAKVHFIYVALEGYTADTIRAMRSQWDWFDVITVKRNKIDNNAECFSIDDWYEPALDDHLKRLFRQKHYDIMLVNYVWFSRALLLAPSGCKKIIDTHDVFGNRHHQLMADGLAPAWFYTTPDEEAKGLDRADIVLAIQPQEAAILAARSTAEVRVVGHLLPAHFLTTRGNSRRLRIGYLASGNPSNVYSFKLICSALDSRPEIVSRFEFVLAGQICAAVEPSFGPFKAKYTINDVIDFYRNVDVVINPNMSGTGLKIKSVEALSYGRPLFSTEAGMVGIDSDAPEHRCCDLDDLTSQLDHIDPLQLEKSAVNSRQAFLAYQHQQRLAVSLLFQDVMNATEFGSAI